MDDSDLIWDWIQEERKRKRKRNKLKQCSKCGETKPEEAFYCDAGRKDGFSCWCKDCVRVHRKARREKNPKKVRAFERARKRAWREKNPEKVHAYSKAYCEKNPEKVSACQKAYRKKNREKRRTYQKAYREKNREKVRACQKAYREKNREKFCTYSKTYRQSHKKEMRARKKACREANLEKYHARERAYRQSHYKDKLAYERLYYKSHCKEICARAKAHWEESPGFRLSQNVSAGMRNSLKSGKDGCHWESLVPYTRADLMTWLESQFEDGMNWENYGSGEDRTRNPSEYWVIDHKRPISSFKFESPDDPEFLECWALSNLRPCWAKENMQKGAKWPYNPPARNKDDEDAKEAS